MTMLDNISGEYVVASTKGPSDVEDIEKLKMISPITLPLDFLDLLSEVSDLELFVRKDHYIRIWGADACIELNEAYHVSEFLPNSLVFGDDGGGGALVYVDTDQGFGVYYVGFGALDIDEVIKISSSLTDLLVHNNGIDILLSM